MTQLTFVIGYDYEEFRNYYRTLKSLHDYYVELALPDVIYGDIGPTDEGHIKEDATHLIVWKENDEIVGHAVWHEHSTENYKNPEAKEALEVLEFLLGDERDFIELHEVWLREDHRGKGFGVQFFDFFENYIRKRFGRPILFYTDTPAAVALCKMRGYTEDWVPFDGEKWHVFYINTEDKQKT